MNAGHPCVPAALLFLTWIIVLPSAKLNPSRAWGSHAKYRACSLSHTEDYMNYANLFFFKLHIQRWWVLVNVFSVAAKHLCQVVLGIVFKAGKVYYSKLLTEGENCCQGSHLSLSSRPWDTWHTQNLQCHPLLPIPVLRIGHLQLPLTFRWISALPEDPDWKQSLGQQALCLHVLRLTLLVLSCAERP